MYINVCLSHCKSYLQLPSYRQVFYMKHYTPQSLNLPMTLSYLSFAKSRLTFLAHMYNMPNQLTFLTKRGSATFALILIGNVNVGRTVQHLYAYITDEDECLITRGGCDENARCVNTPGSFRCVCDDGYTGNGEVCFGQLCYIQCSLLNCEASCTKVRF